MPSVYIKTYGCQMNERDSEAVAAQLVAKGYTLARAEATADVILFNTCSVRDLAEQKALRKMENVAAEVRRHRPGVVLGLIGCRTWTWWSARRSSIARPIISMTFSPGGAPRSWTWRKSRAARPLFAST